MGIFRNASKPHSEMRPSQVEAMEEGKQGVERLKDAKSEYDKHLQALDKIVAYCDVGFSPGYHADALRSALASALVKKID